MTDKLLILKHDDGAGLVDKERWVKLGIAKQLGNIASEIHRVRLWQEKSDMDQMQKSLGRALELIALSIDCCLGVGRKELTRFYEILASHHTAKSPYPTTLHSLEKFCLSHVSVH